MRLLIHNMKITNVRTAMQSNRKNDTLVSGKPNEVISLSPVHTTPERVGNVKINSHFVFEFEEDSGRGIS